MPRSLVLDLRDRAAMLADSALADLDAPASVRVVEMVVPSKDAMVADMAMDDLGLPEALSAMHIAEEIHVHGLSLELALHMLPFVRPQVVENTLLVIHGPWPESERELAPDATRFQDWPGRISYDDAALRMNPKTPGERVAQKIWVDPFAAELLPRACGPIPIRCPEDDSKGGVAETQESGSSTVVIVMGGGLSEELRQVVSQQVATLDDGIQYELIDESKHPSKDRTRIRRFAQLAVFGNLHEQGFFEAAVQKIPMIILQVDEGREGCEENGDDPPIARIVCESNLEKLSQGLRSLLLECSEQWCLANPAPIDTEAMHYWVCARSVGVQ